MDRTLLITAATAPLVELHDSDRAPGTRLVDSTVAIPGLRN